MESEVVQEVEALLGRGAVAEVDFEALEMALRQGTLRLAARALEQRLNADTSDEVGSRMPCRCGGEAQFAGRRSKQFHSVLGPLRLERAYYHCSSCGHGCCPRDRLLGSENTSLSPALTRMTGTVGAMVSFQEGSELLLELAGVIVDAKQVERTAEALGQEIAEDERHHSEPLDTLPLPKTLYLGIDGTGIPLRAEELTGVSGKRAGAAKTREVKLCTVWSAESLDTDGTPIRDKGSITYSAAIESARIPDIAKERSAFAQRVWRESQRRRFPQAERMATLGDGAPWIWNLVEELFPGAIQIVDRFHAKQHLSELSKALYGLTSPRAARWAQRRHKELDSGQFHALLAALRRQVARSEEARRCLHYFQSNRERMRYPEFHAQGLCTSTGVVEAGCKVAIGTRLKRAGMHWTVSGSNAIIALRCSKLSGRFQDFWERRCAQMAA
ncbi:MAG TPA: ISKra4 family transposase [Candidatus Acidoferrum sp.]|nr:ISKra4 family transposase [Candidatus Acidoferrum sp.]